MDLSDLKTWTDGLGVVVGAPHIVVPLLIAIGGIVWWFRRSGVRPDPPENGKGGSNGRATFNVQLVHHTAHRRRDWPLVAQAHGLRSGVA
jgi:hypothetical protein